MSKYRNLALAILLTAGPAFAQPFGLGREALPEEIAAWDIDVMPDGTGLPEGSGDVLTGEELFLQHCAACHGDFAEGLGNWPALTGGEGSLDHRDPVKTVGSYWPHLSTVWDYVHRSMPFGQAQILTADETYAIVAYILYSNNLVDDDFTLSKQNFLEVTLPNAGGFIEDDRESTELPVFTATPCMETCKSEVEITKRASVLDVTPQETANSEAVVPTPEPAETPAETPAAEPAPAADPALIAAGEKVFAKCKACHMIGADAKNRAGPALNGIYGRISGTAAGFKYSPAMTDAAITWDKDNLAAFLADPKKFIPKNKMAFAGLKKPEDIGALIAFLQSQP